MKILLQSTLVFFTLLTACQKPAGSEKPTPNTPQLTGGVDSGGGNFTRSNPSEVTAVFNGKAGFDLKAAVKATMRDIAARVADGQGSAKVQSIIEVMLGRTPGNLTERFEKFDSDVDASNYQLKNSGPCTDWKGLANDAGTPLKMGSDICYSLERLVQIPIEAVSAQLIALAFHEHVHHFGFEESDAKSVQNYILRTLLSSPNLSDFVLLVSTMESISGKTDEIAQGVQSELSSDLICYEVGRLRQQVVSFDALNTLGKANSEKRLLSTTSADLRQIRYLDEKDVTSLATAVGKVEEICKRPKKSEKTFRKEVAEKILEPRELSQRDLQTLISK